MKPHALTPPWRDSLPEHLPAYLNASHDSDLRRAVQRADTREDYLHSSKFQYHKRPAGWTLANIWPLVKFERTRLARQLPLLLQKDGEPFSLVESDNLRIALRRIHAGPQLRGPATQQELFSKHEALIAEAHHSSAIEGAGTTRKQSAELLRSQRQPRNRGEQMVVNNRRTVDRLSEWTRSPLTPQLLCEMQATVTTDTLDDPTDSGRFRDMDDVVVVDMTTQETVFQPPPHVELEERIARLCEFANQTAIEETLVHPIARAALLHHQLAYCHPFVDGNGRAARVLFLWSVMRSGYKWFQYVSVSRAIDELRERYYRSFVHVDTDEGDTTYFVRFLLDCIERELAVLGERLKTRAKTQRWIRELNDSLNSRQLALVQHLRAYPDAEFTVKEHQQYHGVSQPTAYADLERMTKQRLFALRRQGRKKIYRASKRLAALIAKGA